MSYSEAHTAAFESHRGLLTGAAYRMLGSVSDAEDMVQETWLRWIKAKPDSITTPRSWLLTVVSRLCLDRLKSAQVQREQYYGTWLPEPLVAERSVSPASPVDEGVSIALLLVLEKLSPEERAGFLLHEVFGHSFEEISAILDKPVVNCRKMVSRARLRVRAEKPRFTTTNGEHEELLQRFLQACRAGDMAPLLDLLGETATLHSDGGGKASALPEVLLGRTAVARFFVGIFAQGKEAAAFSALPTRFNGAPGLLLCLGGQPVTALSLELQDGRIAAIFAHRNPDKLQHFAASTKSPAPPSAD